MVRIFSLFVAMSLTGAAFLNLSAVAQSSQGAPSIQHSQSGLQEKELKFEVLSIRPTRLPAGAMQGISNPTPNGFTTTAALWQVIVFAYGPPGPAWTWTSVKLENQPSWLAEYYAIDARVSQFDLKAWQSQSSDHELLRSALRAALKERCKLAIHEQPSKEQIYELVVAKGGPKMKEAAPDSTLPVGMKLQSGGVKAPETGAHGGDDWNFYAATMRDLALNLSLLSPAIPVRDRTGLTGRYDFAVRRVPVEPGEEGVYSYPVNRLGLQLRHGIENRPILVIDHVERPTPN